MPLVLGGADFDYILFWHMLSLLLCSLQACKDNGGYGCPELNEKIFLNFHGFHKIQNLEPYTDLKAIFLEGNCLDTLEGLPGEVWTAMNQ